ncbi:MAG: ComEC/Rec2 family competence protein, partial [Actinobacteria bacterium]|nr:ComEC/Rec2 family competence protein [Actinomycetota bacterium]
ALYLGLVLGDDREQSDLDRFRFQATGLGHLLAVSGQNVAFLMLVARPLLERCSLRTRWALGLGVLALFVLVTRAEASVLRAAAMAAVSLVAAGAGRTVSAARILATAVIGLLLVDPLLVMGLGFQLSVCATIGMVVGVRPIAARLRGPRWLAETIAATVAAQLATAPLLVGLNGWIPSVATLVNVVAVPVAGAVMVLGMTVGLLAGSVIAPLSALLNTPTELLVRWIELAADVGSRTPLPLLGVDRLLCVAGAVCVLLGGARRRGRSLLVAGLLLALALAPVSPQPGRSTVTRGVELFVDDCGHRLVTLAGRIDVADVLTSLALHGVVAADVVSGPPGGATSAVAEQLGAVRSTRVGTSVVGELPCTVTP